MFTPDGPGATDPDLDHLAEPESLMPAQIVFHPGRSTALEGERRLVAAVLEDAFLCFRKYAVAADLRGRRLFRQAEKWFMEKDTGAVLTFEFVCDTGGLDADHIRSRLRRWRNEAIKAARLECEDEAVQSCTPYSSNDPEGFKRASGE